MPHKKLALAAFFLSTLFTAPTQSTASNIQVLEDDRTDSTQTSKPYNDNNHSHALARLLEGCDSYDTLETAINYTLKDIFYRVFFKGKANKSAFENSYLDQWAQIATESDLKAEANGYNTILEKAVLLAHALSEEINDYLGLTPIDLINMIAEERKEGPHEFSYLVVNSNTEPDKQGNVRKADSTYPNASRKHKRGQI